MLAPYLFFGEAPAAGYDTGYYREGDTKLKTLDQLDYLAPTLESACVRRCG
jgi:hypothetical protein